MKQQDIGDTPEATNERKSKTSDKPPQAGLVRSFKPSAHRS